MIREIGGVGLCTTDLVNARSLLERNRKSLKLIESSPEDRPLSVQLFGSVSEEMRDAALFLQEQGIDAVDINMGCPVRKVCKVGGGSAMMTEHGKTAHLVKSMVDALKIPVTCKMRLGWDEANITAPDLARALEDVGVSAITIHGRTREQGFRGKVNLGGIRAVVQAVRSIPIIGNGDITTPEAAKIMFEETGCAAIGIGRGAFYNPWIFRHIQSYLHTSQPPSEPTFDERIQLMTRHLDRVVACFGEEAGCRMFRKVATWYSKRWGPASEFNRRIVLLKTRAEFDEILHHYLNWRKQFLDEKGHLRPQYEAQPIPLNFLKTSGPTVTQRESIPVPSGPNEWW